MTLGERWIDQQWLGQLGLYGLAAAGGVILALLAHALLTTSAAALAMRLARRNGASPRAVALVAVLALPAYAITSWQVRTQSFAYVLFAVLLTLLARDARAPGRRVLWVFPLLIVWANVHGSVLLGAALCGLRGIDSLARRDPARHGALLLAAPLSTLVSPYGTDLLSYYRDTALSPAFRDYVTEWQPPTVGPFAIPLALALLGGAVLVITRPRGLTRFELATLALLAASTLLAVRNTPWFTLAMLAIAPLALEPRLGAVTTGVSPRVTRTVLAGAVVALMTAVLAAALRDGVNTERYPPHLLSELRSELARLPDARVYATDDYADWLLWRIPELEGRVAFDIRFELLGLAELDANARFADRVGHRWPEAAAGFRLLVVDRDIAPVPGTSIVTTGRDVALLRR
jgi:hypothetical protein